MCWLFHSLKINYGFGSFVYFEAMANSELAAPGPFLQRYGQSLRERSLDVLGGHPHLISPKSSFLEDPQLCSQRHAEGPPTVSPSLCCCPGFLPKWIFWKYPYSSRVASEYQARLISSSFWLSPDISTWIYFNENLIFYFARGLIHIEK